jgi:hypothetical protein
MGRRSLLVLSVVGTLVGCGAPPVPATGASPSRSINWDGSAVHTLAGQDFVCAGPVAYSVVAGRTEPGPVISWRCAWIAMGLPIAVAPDPGFLDTDVLQHFETFWKPEQARAGDACGDAFGPGWRLPTSEQAQVALAPGIHGFVMLAREPGGRVVAVKRPCPASDRRCYQQSPEQPAVRAPLYCVAPAEHALAEQPSDAEIERCVREVGKAASRSAAKLPLTVIDEGALDFVLMARHTCRDRDHSSFQALLERLRVELGPVTAVEKSLRINSAYRYSKGLVRSLRNLRKLVARSGASPPGGCARFPQVYAAKCGRGAQAADCVSWQAQYRAECQGQDPLPLLSTAVTKAVNQRDALESQARRQSTVQRAASLALSCVGHGDASALKKLLGSQQHGTDSTARHCSCSAEDLDCGLAAMQAPTECSEENVVSNPPGIPCNCAATDLQCHMRCP